MEFLLVDLVNNLNQLAEDHQHVLDKVRAKAATKDFEKLNSTVSHYGNAKAKKLFKPMITKTVLNTL